MTLELDAPRGTARLEVVPVGCGVDVGGSSRSPVVLEAGMPQTVQLAGCTWTAAFLDAGPDPLDLALRITEP